ncbi:hypothetical protein [Haliscomenobacter hydrossis]|uniref:Uncharacterized protein n=1 Tax=Haliscomenobacter hydrossis (strain ATCC 27775 / DSM 1100 / LMG 10767 / O) TaxID=760192 RepID=F4L4K8_HALH1|nr:hypothetical protein [Haliscomenobacter hydrossis]AEE52009.1 hypothetical protein Halhy_4163 [Haliscomenobacter hydrossis DSM 1100]
MMSKSGKSFALKSNTALLLLCLFCLLGTGSSFSCSRKSGCPAVDTISSRLSGGKDMPKAKRAKGGLFPKNFGK